jgi:hypothetical protein
MITNLDKWDYYTQILKWRDNTFIVSIIDKLPEVFYTVEAAFNTPDFYRVGVNNISHAAYWHKTSVMFLNGKGEKPTKKAVEALRIFVEGHIDYDENKIGLFWKGKNTSGAIHWPEYVNKQNIYYTYEEAELKVLGLRAKYILEKSQRTKK